MCRISRPIPLNKWFNNLLVNLFAFQQHQMLQYCFKAVLIQFLVIIVTKYALKTQTNLDYKFNKIVKNIIQMFVNWPFYNKKKLRQRQCFFIECLFFFKRLYLLCYTIDLIKVHYIYKWKNCQFWTKTKGWCDLPKILTRSPRKNL